MSASFEKDDPNEPDDEISSFDLSDEIVKMEIQLIVKTLQRHHGDVQNAANEIGVSVDFLKQRIDEYHIEEMLGGQLKH